MLLWFYHASKLSVFIKPHGGFWIHARQAGSQLNTCTDRQTGKQAIAKRYPTLILFFFLQYSLPCCFLSLLSPCSPICFFVPSSFLDRPPSSVLSQRQCWLTLFSLSLSLSLHTLSSFCYYLNSSSHFLWVTLASLSLSLSFTISHPQIHSAALRQVTYSSLR